VIFSSFEFFVFLAVLLGLLAVTRSEPARRNILLVGSYIFYGWWNWRFCFLVLLCTVVDYVAALKISGAKTPAARKRWLIVSLASNLGWLGFFKYSNFLFANLAPVLDRFALHVPHLNLVLPVGISFFTFQSMSYVIDVYRGTIPATRSLRDFALFVSFFPQLEAGPIVRGAQFLPQLRTIHPLVGENLRTGLERFTRGFVKKVLFADTLAVFVDPVFGHPALYASPTCWLAVIAYAGQIYYDFSAYSDMAIGIARALGFTFPENFDHPYLSASITEFWRRWHMSLSSWLRDYLYIPLGGNRGGTWRTYRNLLITMFLGGLWHGASWTFVAWGMLHGIGLAAHKWMSERRGATRAAPAHGISHVGNWALTFLFVLVTWVFFRAPSFPLAWAMLKKMAFVEPAGIQWYYVQAMVVLVLGTLLHLRVALAGKTLTFDFRRPLAWSGVVAALLVVLLFAPFGNNPFIYFQF